MKETMGQIIRRLRKERNLTQEELAEQLGVTFQAVSKWENDSGMPDISQVVPIANVFGVSTDVLFGTVGLNDDEEVIKIINDAQALLLSPLTSKDLLRKYYALQQGLKLYPNNKPWQFQLPLLRIPRQFYGKSATNRPFRFQGTKALCQRACQIRFYDGDLQNMYRFRRCNIR